MRMSELLRAAAAYAAGGMKALTDLSARRSSGAQKLLQQMGCTVMQGYLYSRPLMPERLTEYLQHWRSK